MRLYEFEEALFHLQYNSHKDCYSKTPKPERVEADERSERFIRRAGLWSKYQQWYKSREWYDRRIRLDTVKNNKDTYWIILTAPRDHILLPPGTGDNQWSGRDLMEQPLHALYACTRRDKAREYGKEFKAQIIDAICHQSLIDDQNQSLIDDQKKEEESC